MPQAILTLTIVFLFVLAVFPTVFETMTDDK